MILTLGTPNARRFAARGHPSARPGRTGGNGLLIPGNDMLNVHINYAPIAAAFAGSFDDYVLTAADPPWQDNHAVADWLENELGRPHS